MQALFKHRKAWTRTDKFYMAFSTAMLCLITIYMSTEAVFGQEMWVVNADFPGGALAWFAKNADVWYQTLGTASSVFLNMLSDALLVRLHDAYNYVDLHSIFRRRSTVSSSSGRITE